MPPFKILPATCELCGQWLPNHQTSCPRNGVHPSQWKFDLVDPSPQYLESQEQDETDDDYED
ncbi:hypothetical protein DM01DRAFT_1408600 [Hesseltinella vesiculosa]|uniref:Uncharacterized protein n=1 Tax=Hesseltinella vesiculosa TaxID=101127 RepID=A0A1X2GE38_9FUNG|nr:hypothetical protein DM01DRAFT_1408600 [Hesseltinella vesiculosa]